MSIITKEKLEETLIDVRNAYRLLHDYQRRVLDTVKLIGNLIGQDEWHGYPLFSGNVPKAGQQVKFDSWSWDWLPMYAWEFYCESLDKQTNGEIKFGIAFQADSAFYESPGKFSEPSTYLYNKAEDSTSYVYFYAGRGQWKPVDDILDQFKQSQQTYEPEGTTFRCKRYSIAALIDEPAIRQTLADANSYFEGMNIPDVCRVK